MHQRVYPSYLFRHFRLPKAPLRPSLLQSARYVRGWGAQNGGGSEAISANSPHDQLRWWDVWNFPCRIRLIRWTNWITGDRARIRVIELLNSNNAISFMGFWGFGVLGWFALIWDGQSTYQKPLFHQSGGLLDTIGTLLWSQNSKPKFHPVSMGTVPY